MRCLFIGGCGRSGTTLLGAMLGALPGAITTPESQFKTAVLHGITPVAWGGRAAAVPASWRFRLWQQPWDRAWERQGLAGAIEQAVSAYGDGHGRPGPSLWIDHTPENIREHRTLATLWPEARFIHLIRDLRAVTASVLPLDWGPNTALAAAPWWLSWIARGLAAESALPERMLRVRYEDLVRRPEFETRRICSWLDVAWDPAVLRADAFAPPSYTGEQHGLVGRPPDPSRLDAWRDNLTARQIEDLEYLAGDALLDLGYTLVTPYQPRPPGFRRAFGADVGEMLSASRNRWRSWRRRGR